MVDIQVILDALANLKHDNYGSGPQGSKDRDADIELINSILHECNSLQSQLDAMRAQCERLRESILALVYESTGVVGLHLNGEIALWDDLLAGGRHEEWLRAIEEQPDQSLAEIEARAIERAVELYTHKWLNGGIIYSEGLLDHAASLRQQAKGAS